MKNKCKKVINKGCRHWKFDYDVARKHLGERFVGNEDAMSKLSGVYATYSKLLTLDKGLVAPRLVHTGSVSSGKTSAVNELARLLKVPCVTVSGGCLTPEGYRGSNLSTALKNLVNQAVSVQQLEKYGGILHVDEFEKIIVRQKTDSFYESLLLNFYGLLGGEMVQIEGDEFDPNGSQLNTQKILVILSGAFSWLDESSFSDSKKTMATLLREGFAPEFVSRLSDHIHFKKLHQKQIEIVIGNESRKLSECYRAGKYTPEISTSKIKNIANEVNNSKLGLRSARRLISEEFFRQSQQERTLSI